MSEAKARPLSEIAREIRADWSKQGKIAGAAKPYLDGMASLDSITDKHKASGDNADGIVVYFLNNAHHWRGEVARRVKAELKLMLPKHP